MDGNGPQADAALPHPHHWCIPAIRPGYAATALPFGCTSAV
jgi:hypothetical protein